MVLFYFTRYIILFIVPNVMVTIRIVVSLSIIISGRHVLVEKVFFESDTAGRRVITLLFLVWHTGTCFSMTNPRNKVRF